MYSYVFDLLSTFSIDSVFDIGCGLGYLGSWIEQMRPGMRYCGVDEVEGFVAYARSQKLNCLHESFKEPQKGRSWAGFDLAALIHTADVVVHRRDYRTRLLLEQAMRVGKYVCWVGYLLPRAGQESKDIYKYRMEYVVEMCHGMSEYFNFSLLEDRFVVVIGG